jgi:hypothetical protein
VACSMSSGAIPSSSFPRMISPFSGHFTSVMLGMSSPVSSAMI